MCNFVTDYIDVSINNLHKNEARMYITGSKIQMKQQATMLNAPNNYINIYGFIGLYW